MISIVLFSVWIVGANVIAMLPSRDHHWTAAYALMAVGFPLLGFVIWQNGPVIGLIGLVAGTSVLRWPMIYLSRWVKARMGR